MSRGPSPKLDQFAELLSQGIEPDVAVAQLGYASKAQGNAMLQRLRKRLGAQAR